MLKRYSIKKKYKILHDILAFPHLKSQILLQHNISNEELNEWKRNFAFQGISGLKATKIQQLRKDMENENF